MIVVIVVTVKKPKIEKFSKVIIVAAIFILMVTPNITGDILERLDSFTFIFIVCFD